MCFRTAECSRLWTDCPDSEMVLNACALTKSTMKYNMAVGSEARVTSGSKANNGRRSGAWI